MRRATGAGAALALLLGAVVGVSIASAAVPSRQQPAAHAGSDGQAGTDRGDRVRAGIGMTVPWAVGGPRIEPNGELIEYPGQWPTLPVSYLRLWDTRTAWLNIEPADDLWDFSRLDAFVALAEAKGVREVNMVLSGTPRWAAAQVRPTDAPWLGPGSASPPRSMDEWTEFVRTVADRYRGRIDSYSIWNEPNNPVFWSGTPTEWAGMVAAAADVISQVDPQATITASGFALDTVTDVDRALPWLEALAARRSKIDVLSFHWYPVPRQIPVLHRAIDALRDACEGLGLPTELWITEANAWGGSALKPAEQRAAVSSLVDQAARAGVDRIYWYAWLDIPPRALMPFQPGTPAARELARIYRR